LINTLRDKGSIKSPSRIANTAGVGAEGNESANGDNDKGDSGSNAFTLPNPPRFFDEDMAKWKKKFVNALKHREQMKKII
jgi:hypothetical protein